MKISKTTIEILRNMSAINDSMYFHAGNKQRIMSVGKSLMVDATLEEDFPKEFGIFKMSQFLGVLSIFKEPDVEFGDKGMIIREDNRQVSYRYTDKSLIKMYIPVDKPVELPSVDVQFDLNAETLANLEKSARMLESPNFVVEGDGAKMTLRTYNPTDKHANSASFDLGEADANFRFIGLFKTLLLIPGNYTVKISKAMMAKFVSTDLQVVYNYPLDPESTFSK